MDKCHYYNASLLFYNAQIGLDECLCRMFFAWKRAANDIFS